MADEIEMVALVVIHWCVFNSFISFCTCKLFQKGLCTDIYNERLRLSCFLWGQNCFKYCKDIHAQKAIKWAKNNLHDVLKIKIPSVAFHDRRWKLNLIIRTLKLASICRSAQKRKPLSNSFLYIRVFFTHHWNMFQEHGF